MSMPNMRREPRGPVAIVLRKQEGRYQVIPGTRELIPNLVQGKLLRLLVLVCCTILWGCGPEIKVPPLTLADATRMQAATKQATDIYRIEPGDTIQIRYVYHPEMNQEEVVKPDGKISAIMVGEVAVAGMTTAEVSKLLVEKTSHNLRNPEIVVDITRYGDKTVYVGGEVGRPGAIPYRDGLSPLQAILAAGGFRDTARLDSIILVRADGQEDDFISRKINLEEVVVDGAKEPIALAPRDVLFVPRTRIANANLWVRQHITDLLPLARPRFPPY